MVISHQHKFIFIKTAKTAGTSVEAFFSPRCGPDDVFTPTRPPVEGHQPRNWQGWFFPLKEILSFNYPIDRRVFAERRFLTPKRTVADMVKRRKFHEHIPARIVKQRVPPEVWNGYHKFTIERNPWDKTLSHYHMQRSVRGGTMTLDEYFERGEFCVNTSLYCDERGGLMVDEVIPYHELAAGIGRLCDRFGIPYEGSLGVRAKGDYRTDRRHYSEVLEPRHLEIIDRVYRKEIDMHGFIYEDHRNPTPQTP
ncbi:hypothetical protein [Haloferula sargassicola]|uniref:Sulfotransferase family protein n=1 Tax=Haloferula sargassicola TaxID=490096 RepID=A0ABP9ULZ5_9BACT